jgi:hypothetical protein
MYFITRKNGTKVNEKGIKILNAYMEKLDQLIVALQANLRVYRAISKFYRDELLTDRRLKARKLPWATDKNFQAEIRQHLDDFQDKMRWVCTSTQEMLRRAVVVRQVVARRESAVRLFSLLLVPSPFLGIVHFTLLRKVLLTCPLVQIYQFNQLRDLKFTRRLSEVSRDLSTVTAMDSSTMRAFSAMTLILLPISIVSTIFSTGIMDFKGGSGGLVGNWSGPAALWWAGTTIVLTVLVRWVSELWRNHAVATTLGARAAQRAANRAVPQAAGDHESWMTPALRAITDVRASAQGYASRIRVRYVWAAAHLKQSLARYKNARSGSPSSPGPKASPPHYSPHSGVQHAQAAHSREQPPLPSSSPPVTSTHSGPPPPQPEGEVDGPIHVDGVELEQLDRVSPQQAQSPEISAPPSPESEEPGRKVFDQASEAERGLLVRVTESKEEATNGTDVEGQERWEFE